MFWGFGLRKSREQFSRYCSWIRSCFQSKDATWLRLLFEAKLTQVPVPDRFNSILLHTYIKFFWTGRTKYNNNGISWKWIEIIKCYFIKLWLHGDLQFRQCGMRQFPCPIQFYCINHWREDQKPRISTVVNMVEIILILFHFTPKNVSFST